MSPDLDNISGCVFWVDSGTDILGQEEKGEHPWLVISDRELAVSNELVIAVPMTSNEIEYYRHDVGVKQSEFAVYDDVKHRLSKRTSNGCVRCAKVRHWSTKRIDEVVARAAPLLVNKIRGVVAEVICVPPVRSRRG